jgi:hypothetical protein
MRDMKIEFEALIENLLYNYECVILPDFGGFIVRDSPANFNADHSVLKPKSKHIFFNPHLTHNDGLLYNEIQKQQNVSYSDAAEYYKQTLQSFKSELNEKAQLKFGNLGIFFQNESGQIWFSPDQKFNLSIDSFGLFPVDVVKISQSIETETQKTQTIVRNIKPIEVEKQTVLADNAPIEQTYTTPKLSMKAWLVAASVALIAHFVYLNVESNNTITQHEAAILPSIGTSESTQNSLKADTLPNVAEIENTDTAQTTDVQYQTLDNNPATDNPIEPVQTVVENSISTVTPVEIQTIEPEFDVHTETVSEVPQINYTKIAKYKMEANALSHKQDLEKKGKTCKMEHNGDWFEVYVEQ